MPPTRMPVLEPAVFAALEPLAVWRHFENLCRYPRPSKHEAPLRDALRAWAQARGLDTAVDAAGNLRIRKPPSEGRSGAQGVVLQAHLDMVCQKNTASSHDFLRDPIAVTRDGDWLVAEDTTLGADNGIGVALILAALEDPDIEHGPLEALLTVDEEAGMGGARGLSPDWLAGRLMLNLDTEEWGEFFIGCAGGLDVEVSRHGTPVDGPAGWEQARIELYGLRGGHSGVDIHEERGNAIKLLVRVLCDLEERFGVRLGELRGGSARNALPREAWGRVAFAAGQRSGIEAALADWQGRLLDVYAGVEPSLSLSLTPTVAGALMGECEQRVWLDSLHAAPHGVRRWSAHLPGVVETSNNLGIVSLSPQSGECSFMVRSLRDGEARALGAEIVSLFRLSGSRAQASGHYPGWAPKAASPLLALCQETFRREFGEASRIQVIHAGLECGLIAEKYPDMDIVSMGPTIRGAHAPGERVDIASVGRVWRLLVEILRAVSR